MKLIITSFDLILSIFIFSSVFTFFLYSVITDFNILFNTINQFSNTLLINSKIQNIIFLTKNIKRPNEFIKNLLKSYTIKFISFNAIALNPIVSHNFYSRYYLIRTISNNNRISLLVIKNETK